jgi:hypothetical protein
VAEAGSRPLVAFQARLNAIRAASAAAWAEGR